jgi:hypothetical protein
MTATVKLSIEVMISTQPRGTFGAIASLLAVWKLYIYIVEGDIAMNIHGIFAINQAFNMIVR